MLQLARRRGFRVVGWFLFLGVMLTLLFTLAGAPIAIAAPPTTTPAADPALTLDLNGILNPTQHTANGAAPGQPGGMAVPTEIGVTPTANAATADPGAQLTAAPASSAPTSSAAATTTAAPAAAASTAPNSSAADLCSAVAAGTGGPIGALTSLTCSGQAAAVAVIDFASDPLGYLTDAMAKGASGIMSWVAKTANNATSADITQDWWVSAYKQAFAIGVILWAMLLLWNLVELARHKIGPDEFVESVTLRSVGYIGGVVFGPPLCKFLIDGAGILANGIINAMPGYNGGNMDASSINASIDGAGAGKVIGGAFIALLLLLLVCVAALFLFISLAVQTVAIYLSGAVFPIAFAWIVNVKHHGGSLKVPFLVLGVVFARPLEFFLIGLGMAIARAAVLQGTDDVSRNLANVIMAAVVLTLAAFAPLLLLKYAPVIPTGHGGGSGHGGAVSNPGVAQPGPATRLRNLASKRGGGAAAAGTGGAGAAAAAGAAAKSKSATAAASAGASPSANEPARKSATTGGRPSAAAAVPGSGSGPRQIDGGTPPRKPSPASRVGAAAAAVGGKVKAAPAAAKSAVRNTPAAAKRAVKQSPGAAWNATKSTGRGARKAAPAVAATAAGTAAAARRVGSAHANSVGGEEKW